MPTWGYILEALLSSFLPVNLFFQFCCPPWSHGPDSSLTPRDEWESGSLGAATGEQQTAVRWPSCPCSQAFLRVGSHLSEFLIARSWLTQCDGEFCVSACLDHRYLAPHYFWVRIFRRRLAFGSVDWEADCPPSVSRHHPVHCRPERNNKVEEGRVYSLWLTAPAGTLFFPCPQVGDYTIRSPGPKAFRLRVNYITSLAMSPACRWQILGLVSL